MLAPFFHVGLVVPELGEAQRNLSATLGLSWAKPQRGELPMMVNGGLVRRDISFVYSVEGPPYIELIGAGEHPWQAAGGLHHLGIWSEDIVADMEALVAARYTITATGVSRKGTAAGFAYLTSPTGVLLELVDTRSRESFNRWLSGGDYLVEAA